MKKNEHLFYIIKSLSKAEKRYFKLFAATHKTDNQFIEFYDYLVGESEKDEPFKSNSKQGTIPVKRYLTKQILKSLRNYHEKNSIDIQIQNLFSEISILYSKKLGEPCCELIGKTREIAEKHEKFGLLLQVFSWERRLKFILDKTKRTEQEILEDEKQVLEKYINLNSYQHLFSEVSELKKKLGYIDEKNRDYLMKVIIRNEILSDEKYCLSKGALYYYYYTLTIGYWMLRQHTHSYKYSSLLFDMVSKKPIDEERFHGMLEHITTCVCMGYYHETLNKLQLSEKILMQSELSINQYTVSRFQYYCAAYLPVSYMYLGNTNKLKQIIKDAENSIQNPDSKKEEKLVVSNNLRTAYVYLGDMKMAWEKQKFILTNIENKLRADIYNEMLLFNVFYYMSKKEYAYAKSSVNTAISHFSKGENYKNTIEFIICTCFKSIHETSNETEVNDCYQKICDRIKQYVSEQEGLNNYLEDYFFYYFWSQSTLKNRPIADIMVEWHNDHSAHLRK